MQRSRNSSRSSRFGLITTALLCALCQFPHVLGQTTRSLSGEAQQADKQLNQDYQQLMQKLAPPAREQLRKAERAWLLFTELNKAAMLATTQKRAGLRSEVQEAEIQQVQTRSGELSNMLYPEKSGSELAAELRRADEELNVVYRRCIGGLTPAEVSKLREAQRAWVAFLDATRPFGVDACLRITGHRTNQLNDFYIRAGTTTGHTPAVEQKADPSVPDPFERAR